MKIESTFKDKEFEKLVLEENSKNSNEIFSFMYKDKKYWVKKARATSSNIFHKLFYKLTSFDVLLPVENKNDLESLLFESNKLIEFNNLGINTPNVLGRNEKVFVLEDCGKTVYHYLKNDKYIDLDKKKLFDDVMTCLTKIHNSGNYHGGAQVRNFTYKDEKVFAIDFEDSFDKDVDLKVLQFRDLLLFLLSMTKLKNASFSYEYIVNTYEEKTSNSDIKKSLELLINKWSFLIKIKKIKIVNNILPDDAKKFIELLEEINTF